jgi:SHS2 domain-containing protein
MKSTDFELFDHTADIGLRLARPVLSDLYRDAAYALFALIAPKSEFQPLVQKKVQVQGDDSEQLLVNWLSELNFLFLTDQYAPAKINVSVNNDIINAVLWGEIVDPDKHDIELEIKAVTYHKIYVKQDGDLWRAQVIFDI